MKNDTEAYRMLKNYMYMDQCVTEFYMRPCMVFKKTKAAA